MMLNSYVIILATLSYVSAEGISSYPVSHYGPVGYHRPLAKSLVLSDGHLADTHEVAAARNAQYVTLADAAVISGGGYGYNHYYGHGNAHEVYTYGPGTDDIYRGEYGYAGLHSAPYDNGYDRRVYSYGQANDNIYREHYGYQRNHSIPYNEGYDYAGHGARSYGQADVCRGHYGYAGHHFSSHDHDHHH